MQIIYTEQFTKKLISFFKDHPDMKKRYEKIIRLLKENIFHPSLRLHQLQGIHKGIYSISINLSYRITLELKIEKETVILLSIGNHDKVY